MRILCQMTNAFFLCMSDKCFCFLQKYSPGSYISYNSGAGPIEFLKKPPRYVGLLAKNPGRVIECVSAGTNVITYWARDGIPLEQVLVLFLHLLFYPSFLLFLLYFNTDSSFVWIKLGYKQSSSCWRDKPFIWNC